MMPSPTTLQKDVATLIIVFTNIACKSVSTQVASRYQPIEPTTEKMIR